jgi:S-adenosylmethionine uptake transporter
VLTRRLGVSSRASAMAVYIQGTFLVVSAGFWLVAGDGRHAEGVEHESLQFLLRAWVWPAAGDWPLFLLAGAMSAIIGYSLSSAYRSADAAVIAPFEYVALPLAIFWGFVIFGEVPGPWTMAGIALIAGAGIYVFLRERARDRPVSARRVGLRR